MPYFVEFVEMEGYDYTVVLDGDTAGDDQREHLIEERNIREEDIIQLDDIIPQFDSYEAEIEDMFNETTYSKAFARTHEGVSEDEVLEYVQEGIGQRHTPNALKEEFHQNIHSFDKSEVMEFICSGIRDEEVDLEIHEETEERFTELIEYSSDF
jgi:hypothetical protein